MQVFYSLCIFTICNVICCNLCFILCICYDFFLFSLIHYSFFFAVYPTFIIFLLISFCLSFSSSIVHYSVCLILFVCLPIYLSVFMLCYQPLYYHTSSLHHSLFTLLYNLPYIPPSTLPQWQQSLL